MKENRYLHYENPEEVAKWSKLTYYRVKLQAFIKYKIPKYRSKIKTKFKKYLRLNKK